MYGLIILLKGRESVEPAFNNCRLILEELSTKLPSLDPSFYRRPSDL